MSTTRAETRSAFAAATIKTFSEMAFIDVTEATKPIEELEYSHIIYQSFLEPDIGDCALYLPYNCKKTIVENIYGEEWENLNPDQTDDCLLELCNVLAGNYLIHLYGEDERRDMSLPQLLFDEKTLRSGNYRIECFYFLAEEVPFKTYLRSLA